MNRKEWIEMWNDDERVGKALYVGFGDKPQSYSVAAGVARCLAGFAYFDEWERDSSGVRKAVCAYLNGLSIGKLSKLFREYSKNMQLDDIADFITYWLYSLVKPKECDEVIIRSED